MKILKNLIGAAGLVALIAAIALAARDGYAAGITPANRIVIALVFSIVALAGIAGPAVAFHLCRSPKLRMLGILVGLVSAAALTANVAYFAALSPGQKAGASPALRFDAPASTSSSTRDPGSIDKNENELKRAIAERSALYFTPTSEAAIAAARAEFIDINAAYSAQCDDKHDAKCDGLAAELTAKRDAFLAAMRNRIATKRAEELDAEVAGIRASLASMSPHPEVQSARQRESDAPEGSAWRQLAMVLIGELAIACALLVWSLPDAQTSTAAVQGIAVDVRPRGKSRVPARDEDVTRFTYECLSRASGEGVPLQALYLRFLDWCDEQGLLPLPPRRFSQAVVRCCAEAQIDVCHDGKDVIFLDVRPAPANLLH